jgi:hypothetical protein
MESSEAEFGWLCTSVQMLVNLMETRYWDIGGRLLGGCAPWCERNKDRQRKDKSMHRTSP